MLDRKNLFELGRTLALANSSSPVAYSFGEDKFGYTELNDLFRNELNELGGTYSLFRENKNLIFSLMEEMVDAVLPVKVMEQYGQFAEIKTYAQGDKAVFIQRITTAAKRRAKKFVTKVGLAGIYEVFKLDGMHFELPTTAYGGAAQIGFEEFLDGRVQMSDVLDIILEGLDECIYKEIADALHGSIAQMPAANVVNFAGFDEALFDELLAISDSYGSKAVIYCTYRFASTIVPATGWVSDEIRNQKWQNGFLGSYKGHQVVVLNQSYTDETNSERVLPDETAFIIPAGAEKPVKIAFEGQTIVRDYENMDMSREIQIYKKMGVAVITTNNICAYTNTDLA